MRLQIEIPLQVTIYIQNKKIPIKELTSALKGLEAAILGRVLEKIDSVLISSICGKEYGKNDYHKHSREERTIVTHLGKTTFKSHRSAGSRDGRVVAKKRKSSGWLSSLKTSGGTISRSSRRGLCLLEGSI